MKKIMKKALSLILVLALAIVPMTAMAATGDYVPVPDWQYCIYSGDTVTVEAGATTYFEIGTDGTAGTYDFVVEGTGAFDVAICTEGVASGHSDGYAEGTPVAAVNGKVETEITSYESTSAYAAFSITNKSDSSVDYTCTVVFPEGTQGNPKAVTLAVGGTTQVTVPANNQYYVAVKLPEMYKEYQLTVSGNTGFGLPSAYGQPTWDTNGELITTVAAYYGPASSISIINNTASEQTYTLTLNNMPVGSQSNPEVYEISAYATSKILNGTEHWYKWTAPEEGKFTLTIVDSASSEQWTYKIDNISVHKSTAWDEREDNVAEVSVQEGEEVFFAVSIPTYNSDYDCWDAYTPGAGKVVFLTSFVAGETGGSGAGGEQEGETTVGGNTSAGDNYVGSESPLVNGSNAVSTEKDYTIFTFQPTEVGKYTFTSTDGSKLAIASYNGMWVTIVPSEDTVNQTSVSWECTDVQQSVWLAVDAPDNVENANILIIKEDVVIPEIEKEVYKNTVTPATFKFTGDANKLEYVETTDKNVDRAVLGKDGFYHLNSENGPILFVDLDDDLMNLPLALDRGDVCHIIYDENNVATKKIIYSDALKEYLACADADTKLYPLTADLIEIYKKAGETQGWYGSNGFVGGTEDDAWMFACYYQEGLNTLGNSTSASGGTSQAPDTGDNANVAVWAIVMVIAAGAAFVVAESKRRAR